MRFVTYRDTEGSRLGVVCADNTVVEAETRLASHARLGLLEVVQDWDRARRQLTTGSPAGPLAEIELLAPLHKPLRNIFCVGKNYRDHDIEFTKSGFDARPAERNGAAAPLRSAFFTKSSTSVIGPRAAIDPHTGLTEAVDYEGELAVIIGRSGRGITAEHAWDYVWGYTIINDITARDLQRDHQQWFLGKSLDTFCPMGPCAVTTDEVDVESLTLRTTVNDTVRQHDMTCNMVVDIPSLIEQLSAGITLLPGDILATGTPAGVGAGFDPPRFLQPGDAISVEISRLGTLSNYVAAEKPDTDTMNRLADQGLVRHD
jgi:2-keto-4-pentenoate hydratase/2-oxohepta-3-ene-1,7-dioic acid hydratase in catechol pathway